MPVTREQVTGACRSLLNRDPNSEGEIERLLVAADWRVLRLLLIESPEYRDNVPLPASALPAGRFNGAPANDIEIDATPTQMSAMFERVYNSWSYWGEKEPFWSVLSNPIYYRDNFKHSSEAFFHHGRYDVGRLRTIAQRAGGDERFKRVLDYGCGVGRLTVDLALNADEAVGVDVSAGHLHEAAQAAARFGVPNIDFKRLASIADIDALGSFDLIVSLMVLQHNPPPIMVDIYRRILRRLSPGGIAIIQLPTHIAGYKFDIESFLAGDVSGMEMNPLPQRVLTRIVREEGCQVVEILEDGGCGAVDGVSHIVTAVRPMQSDGIIRAASKKLASFAKARFQAG